jgi:dienelactone hydrolase
MKHANLSSLASIVVALSAGTSAFAADKPMTLAPITLQSPKTYPADGIKADGVTGVFFDAMPWKGKPTRAFAWYGLPQSKSGEKWPGMVLVHGGGGTAFAEWVRLWTSRGYAAIAVDTCGAIPKGSYNKWERSAFGGPQGWGGLTDAEVEQPATDQWTYHAISEVALAHSLLRSLPGVDADHIGITGISWGGYLACISAGLDARYKLAVPVYGCGFLGDDSLCVAPLKSMTADHRARWLAMWDPSKYLPSATVPMLWVTGTNDLAFPMDSLQKSYRLPKSERTLCITVRMPHGHGGPGENPPEILAFADSILKRGEPLPKVTGQGFAASSAWATFSGKRKVTRPELVYTTDTGPWEKREWKTQPAKLAANADKVMANLPDKVTVFYFNLVDEHGLTVSTEHEEREAR